jgi:Fic family protein
MHMALANLDYYLREYQGHAPIVRCALAHAQFETIHPFIDGNGRIGRMLIALMLSELNVLSQPLLYPSLFLRHNRSDYYDRLTAIRLKGDWASWIDFFALGLKQTAEEALRTCEKIAALKAQTEAGALPKNTRRALELMFAHPILDANAAKRHMDLGFDAASDALKRLEGDGWIEEITGKRRGRTYRFSRYINILELAGDEVSGKHA